MNASRAGRLWCAVAIAAAARCAHQVSPGGGPADLTAPKVVTAVPDRGARLVARDSRIEVTFSEWIAGQNADKVVTVFPPPPGGYETRVSGKTLTIDPRDSLADSTTYHVEITTALKDLRGNSIGTPYRLVFSTGSSLDSGAVEGCVVDPEKRTHQPKVALVRVDSGVADRALLAGLTYLAQTDSGGVFALEHVRPGSYELFAFDDVNGDSRFQPGREQAYAGEGRQVSVSGTRVRVALYPVASDTTTRRITSCTPLSDRTLSGTWNRPPLMSRSPERPSLRVVPADSSGTAPSVVHYVPRAGGREFAVALSEPLALVPYWLCFELEPALPLGDSVSRVDSVRFNGSTAADTAAPRLLSPARIANVELEPRIRLAWSEPVRCTVRWLTLEDSLGGPVKLSVDTGFADTMVLRPARRLAPGRAYRLSVPDSACVDLSGLSPADTVERAVRLVTVAADSVCLSLSGSAPCLGSDKQRTWVYVPLHGTTRHLSRTGDRVFRFDSIPGSLGRLAWFLDRNGDGLAGRGQLVPFVPPEPYVPLYDTVEARARWDIEGVEMGVCDICERGQVPRAPDTVAVSGPDTLPE